MLPNEKALSAEERARYGKIYCGICKSLSSRYGGFAKFTLNYDIAFLALVLSCVYSGGETSRARCISRPIKPHEYLKSELIDYAADMNVVLSYHKLLDDYNDEKSVFAKNSAKKLKPSYERVYEKYPEVCAAVESAMSELSELERAGECSADRSALAFAKALGAVFSYGEKSKELSAVGIALGKFIYIADACIDLKKDLKKARYNPMSFYERSDFTKILELLSAEINSALESLPEVRDDEIVRNIVYSGMWLKYEILKGKEK